jgi:hypothetical protein
VPTVEEFIEPDNYNHFDAPRFSGYFFHDLLDLKISATLKKEVENIVIKGSTYTFLTNTSIFKYNGKKYKLGHNIANDRFQNVIFDFSFHPEYWYQTKETIYDWTYDLILKTCSPCFIRYFQTVLSLHPFNEKKFIPYRLHINNMPDTKTLSLHTDGNLSLFSGDFFKTRQYSITHYLYNHVPNLGGELFTINGFVVKPKENTSVVIKGHQTMHGVTENLNGFTRLAFTSRWGHVDDLFLPGHPDKHVWNVSTSV